MLFRKFSIGLTLILGTNLMNVHAQSVLNIENSQNSISSFNLTDIRKLTFSNGSLYITEFNGNSNSYAISNIKKLYFNSSTTGIQDNSTQDNSTQSVEVYPNPVSNLFYLKCNTLENNTIYVEIIDLQGKIVKSEKTSTNNGIDISNLKNGLYICKLIINDSMKTVKIIKQ